jgi:hypothetical protein
LDRYKAVGLYQDIDFDNFGAGATRIGTKEVEADESNWVLYLTEVGLDTCYEGLFRQGRVDVGCNHLIFYRFYPVLDDSSAPVDY